MTYTKKEYFQCNECNKLFTEIRTLKKHMSIHTGEKPYTCSICKKSFAHNSSLKRHFRLHTGEKSYIYTRIKLIN